MHYRFFLKFFLVLIIPFLQTGNISFASTIFSTPADSIGLTKRNGQTFILHKVSPQETLYAISRKYQVTVEEITKNNPDVDARDISVGDTLQIPLKKEFYKRKSAGNSAERGFHQVKENETLYSIATQYNVSVDQLMAWNNLESTNIAVGQRLKINAPGGTFNEPARDTSQKAIMHEVKASETLFSISQKYNVEVQDIKEWNNLMDPNIVIGQGLKIYPGGKTPDETAKVKKSTQEEEKGDADIHKVKPKETLYSLAVKYNVKVKEIMDWNDLETEVLHPGQELIVDESAAPRAEKSTVTREKAEKKEEGEEEKVENEEEEPNLTASKEEKRDYSSMEARKKRFMEQKAQEEKERNNYKRINQTGLAEKIEGTADTEKFLALHRTAPIGTIMEIKNEQNNLSLFVRVIGRLPDTGENKKILIKISQKAFEGLEAVNNRFPVELSYIP